MGKHGEISSGSGTETERMKRKGGREGKYATKECTLGWKKGDPVLSRDSSIPSTPLPH